MTRPIYGGAGADFGAQVVGGYFHTEGATLPVWSAATGGTQITDMQTLDGTAIAAVTLPSDGSVVAVKMPNNYAGEAWVGPSAGPRVRLTPPAGGTGADPVALAADPAFTAAYEARGRAVAMSIALGGN